MQTIFISAGNGALLKLRTYSRSPDTHLQQNRHDSVPSHNLNLTFSLSFSQPFVQPARCRTGLVQLCLCLYCH
jgi:hypothetical protein